MFDATGAVVVAPAPLTSDGDERLAPAVAALAPSSPLLPDSAGFVVAAELQYGGVDGDIRLQTYSQTGTLRDTLTVNASVSNDDHAPDVAQLENGNIVVTFHRDDGAGTDLYQAIYSRTLTPVLAPTLIDGTGTDNRDAQVLALDDGGYAVAYAEETFVSIGNVTESIAVLEQDVFSTQGIDIHTLAGGAAAGDDGVGSALAGLQSGLLAAFYSNTTTGGVNGELLRVTENYLSDAASDVFVATGVAERFTGGLGSDSLSYGNSGAGVTVDLGLTLASGGFATFDIITGVENLVGSAQADDLTGDGLGNALVGGGGNDTLAGLAGRDNLQGGAGNDGLYGGGRRDQLRGDVGDDQVNGGAGGDRLEGGAGHDNLQGAGGRDRLLGDAGDDTLTGGGGRDVLEGGDGNDRLLGNQARDRLEGGSGADRFYGGQGADLFDGGAGADVYIFGDFAGRDRVLNFADLTLTAIGGGVRVAHASGAQIDLLGVGLNQINDADFI